MTNPQKKQPSIPVKPGQLWVDNDHRLATKRFVKVASVGAKHAECETWYVDNPGTVRIARILLSRFKPIATGYRLATEQEVAAHS
jgi:hypothetical protein